MTIADKTERNAELDRISAEVTASLADQFPEREGEIKAALRTVTRAVRQRVLRDKGPVSTAAVDDIRQLSAEIEVVPRAHGSSALFERGETQIMGVTTLNMLRMEQQLDTLNPVTRKRYMHNYNPPTPPGDRPRRLAQSGVRSGTGRWPSGP